MVGKGSLVGWVAGLPSASAEVVTNHRDIAVPMRDGVVLRADRYVPDGDETAPVVLIRSSYGRRAIWRWLYCLPLARRGYQVVIQSCRGTEDSEGEFTPFDERGDGHDTVAWLRAQPWYPGRFATFGTSYLGFTQWALADAAPAELVAMTPSVTSSALGRSMFVGGAFSQSVWMSWSALIEALRDRGHGFWTLLRARAIDSRRIARALGSLPLGRADEHAVGRTVGWWQQWLAHPDPQEAYWARFDHSAVVPQTRAPVAMVTGWHDLFLPLQLADWQALPESTDKRLVIGPWSHEDPGLSIRHLQEAIAWLDVHAHGRPDRLEGGPVRYHVAGADQWRDALSWPPPADDQAWFLHAGGGLSPAEPPDTAPTRYRYDPAVPTPTLGGPTAQRRPQVRQGKVEARSDVLVFTGNRLEAPLEVVGPVRATVHLRSSVEHTDVVVRLCDVDQRGRSVNVCDGIRRVIPVDHPADAEGVREVGVELWPTAYQFNKGHRVRVQVASADFPRFARNTGTGEPPASATRLCTADQEVFHEPERPSHIVLPIHRKAP